MKRLLLSTMVAAFVLSGSTAYAMTTDDIIQLCKAGFTPDRIAKIVDATGLDEPLTASDWARIRNDGCDDKLVDALLEVLVPVDENGEETDQENSGGVRQSDVNVYVREGDGWGWGGGYGGLSYGWYDPFWSVGWTSWDPYWGWAGWGYPSYWYANDWWGYPYRHRFGCGPFFYHSNWYNGGYYSSGHYARYKASRRGTLGGSYYASIKTPQTVQRGLVAKTVAFQASSTSFDRATGLRSKSVSPSPTTIRGGTTATDRAYTTRSKGAGGGTVSRGALRSKGSGATVEGKSSTGAARYGTVKTRGQSKGTPSTGAGTDGNYGRTRTKSSGTTQSTPPTTSTKQKSTPPPAGNDGGKGSIKRDAGTPEGTSQGTPAPRKKG